MLRSVCVFCGSAFGRRPVFRETAQTCGRLLAERGIAVVYGGGGIGLMGTVADAALAAGGEVIGVLPDFMAERELAHAGLTELHVVSSMHERKALMERLSDAFIALPGGWGTMDELFEILTWGQLGLHAKPVGLWDVDDYFEPLWHMVDHTVREGFVHDHQRARLLRAADGEALLTEMSGWEPPTPIV